jgi:F1F0 ATPase subunit 2
MTQAWAEAASGVGAVSLGMVVALLYLRSLWWSVQRVAHVRWPLAWLAAGFLLRAALTAAALLLIAGADAARLLLALAGFLAARALVLRRVRQHTLADDGRARA